MSVSVLPCYPAKPAKSIGLSDHRLLCVDQDWHEMGREIRRICPWRSGLRRLAYIICTSASIGKSKGVQIPHRTLANSSSLCDESSICRPTVACWRPPPCPSASRGLIFDQWGLRDPWCRGTRRPMGGPSADHRGRTITVMQAMFATECFGQFVGRQIPRRIF